MVQLHINLHTGLRRVKEDWSEKKIDYPTR